MSDLDTIRERHSGTHVCGGHLYDASEALAGRYCDTRVVLDALDDGVTFTVDSLAKALDAVTTDGWPDDQYDFDGTIPEFAAAIIQAAKEAER